MKLGGAVSEELQRQTVSVVYLILAIFLSSKGALLPGKKLNQNFLQIYAPTHNSFITTKFHKILLSSFIGVALTKNRTDGLTEGTGSKTHYVNLHGA